MSRSTVPHGRPGRDPQAQEPTHPGGTAPSQDGRGPKGRFTANNAGGPGNPFARQVAALRGALVQAVTPDDIRAIALELLTQAKCGNLAAIKLLLSYVIGQPTAAPNPDAVEVDEWQLRRQAPTAAAAQETLFARRPPGLVNAAARAVATVQQREVVELFRGDVTTDAPPAGAAPPRVGHESPAARLGAPPGATDAVNKRGSADGVDGLAALLRLVMAPPGVPAGGGPSAAKDGWLIDEVNESLRRQRGGERH